MSSVRKHELTPDMLDRVAREVGSIRARSGSAAPRTETERTKLPNSPTRSEMVAEAEQLRSASLSLDSQVGRMPPQPPTLRGGIGAPLVRLVQRALFWYSQQVNEVIGKIAEALLHQAQNIGENMDALDRLSGAATSVARDLVALRASVRKQEPLTSAVADVARDQAALRASVQRRESNLEQLTSAVTGVTRDLTALRASVQQQENRLEQLSGAIEALQSVAQRQQENDRLIAGRIEAISASSERAGEELKSLRTGAERSGNVWDELSGRVRKAELYAQGIRAELAVERSRVSLLMQQRRQSANAEKPSLPAQESNLGAELGPLYLQFENAFRGVRGEIKGRAIEYLPLLREKSIGTAHMPILDLGCGRGEWLELLSENGLDASGVESNAAFVEECRTRGLVVHHGDAIRFLRDALPESQGAITGFHIIEHLPFSELLDLLDEAVRVLKPGGILMLETPNPANLIVGAHTFYLDPTHIRPLPADLMRFLVESRGFCDARIVPLHPFPECYQLDPRGNGAAEVLNQFLYGPRDYMVIGQRP